MKKNASRRMFILVMSMTVILIFVTTRRESYNPWLPWNWFRKPEPPRPMPEPPRSTPDPPRSTPERPRPMPEPPQRKIPRPMPGRPYLMPKPPRPGCHPFSKDLRCQGSMDARDLVFLNRPAQPISPGVEARKQPR
jgi:hypothetical protein